MEKLIFAIILLAALSGIPGAVTDARIEWAIELNSGDRAHVELRIESPGTVEWRILLRSRNLRLIGCGCLSHWRPCHA
jgi:hypothetical protein